MKTFQSDRLIAPTVTVFLVALAVNWVHVAGVSPSYPMIALVAASLGVMRRWSWNWWLTVPFVVIACGHLVSTLFNDHPFKSPSYGGRLLITLAVVQIAYSLALVMVDHPVSMWPTVLVVFGGFTIMVIAGGTNIPDEVIHLARGGPIRRYLTAVFGVGATQVESLVGAARVDSNIRHGPTTLLLLAGALVVWRGHARWRVPLAVAIAIAVTFSLSRSSWLAAAIPMALILLLQARRWMVRRRVTPLGLVVAVTSVVWVPLIGTLVLKRLSGNEDRSAELRFDSTRDALNAIRHSPLTGANSEAARAYEPHNLILESGLLGGITSMLGAVLLLAAAAWIILRSGRRMLTSGEPGDVRAAIAVTICSSVTIVRMLSSGSPLVDLPLWAGLGLAFGIYSTWQTASDRDAST